MTISKYKGIASNLTPEMVKDDPRARHALSKAFYSAVIYARVSSTGDRQDTERQVADLTAYAGAAGLDIVAVYREKASGAKDDREVLTDCLEALKAGKADTLLLSELSRLGRSVRKILDVTDDLTKAGVNIHILDLNIDTLLPDGTENPVAKMLRDSEPRLSERTSSAA